MAFSQASVSPFASQEDPLGLFPEQHIEESLAEPAQEMLCIQDLPLGSALAEPASQAGQEEASFRLRRFLEEHGRKPDEHLQRARRCMC